MKRLFALLMGMVIILGLTVQAQADLIANTDSSWRVTASDPGAGSDWYSNLLYSDAGWEAATVLYGPGPGYTANGIWSSAGQFSTTETTIWVRKSFNLASQPLTAAMDGAFDDDGELYVNGVLVIEDHSGDATQFYADIASSLVAGDNLIAYRVFDNYPVWGYNHSSWLQVNGEFASVPEPGTLLLLGSGLIGLGFIRRKLKA